MFFIVAAVGLHCDHCDERTRLVRVRSDHAVTEVSQSDVPQSSSHHTNQQLRTGLTRLRVTARIKRLIPMLYVTGLMTIEN